MTFYLEHKNYSVFPKRENHEEQGPIGTDLRRWLCPTCRDRQRVMASGAKLQPKCSTCQLVVLLVKFLEVAPDLNYEFDPVFESFDWIEETEEDKWDKYNKQAATPCYDDYLIDPM